MIMTEHPCVQDFFFGFKIKTEIKEDSGWLTALK